MTKVTPKERLAQIAEEMGQLTEPEDLTSELVRLGARRLLEAEVTERLGRDRYERRPEGAEGYRNSYKQRRLDTAEGRIEVRVPQVRDAEAPFRLELWEAMRKRTAVLERLVVEMYARGLLGRSTVSRVTETLWEEYEAFSERDLSRLDVVYLFADAV